MFNLDVQFGCSTLMFKLMFQWMHCSTLHVPFKSKFYLLDKTTKLLGSHYIKRKLIEWKQKATSRHSLAFLIKNRVNLKLLHSNHLAPLVKDRNPNSTNMIHLDTNLAIYCICFYCTIANPFMTIKEQGVNKSS